MKKIKTFHFILTGFVVLSAMSILIGAEAEQWKLHPEWLWCDDFESTSVLSKDYQDVSVNGMSKSTTDAFDGTRCLLQHYNFDQVDAGWVVRKNTGDYPEHVYMRFYHKFDKDFDGFPPKMARIRYRKPDWTSPLEVHCWIHDGVVVADVKAYHSTQANSVGWLPVANSKFTFRDPKNLGRWVCFEMEVLLNTPGKKDGLYRMWADDSLIVERLNVDLRGSETYLLNEAMLDCYYNHGSPKAQNRYYDNFIVSTKKIGLMKQPTPSSKDQKIEKTRVPKTRSSLHGESKKSKARHVSVIQNSSNKKVERLLNGGTLN